MRYIDKFRHPYLIVQVISCLPFAYADCNVSVTLTLIDYKVIFCREKSQNQVYSELLIFVDI